MTGRVSQENLYFKLIIQKKKIVLILSCNDKKIRSVRPVLVITTYGKKQTSYENIILNEKYVVKNESVKCEPLK